MVFEQVLVISHLVLANIRGGPFNHLHKCDYEMYVILTPMFLLLLYVNKWFWPVRTKKTHKSHIYIYETDKNIDVIRKIKENSWKLPEKM